MCTSSMQRFGAQMRWKDFEAKRARDSKRSSAVKRSLGVVYLNWRY